MEASKYQKKVSAANEDFLARRDAGLAEQRQQAALDARTAQANNSAPQGGQFLGGDWRPDNWQSAAQQQAEAAGAQRAAGNAAYVRQASDFSNRGLGEIQARLDTQNLGVLTAAKLAFDNGGMTPMTAIAALSNDISDAKNEYIGSAFRGRGKDMRFCVFTRGANGHPTLAKQYSMADLFRAEQAAGGGIFSTANWDMGRKQMGTYMTDAQIDKAIGHRFDADSIMSRMTGGAGGRDVGGVTASGGTARRLFGAGGDNRSRISFFGTGGAGTGYTMRDYNGHTGEDTGFVDDATRQAQSAATASGAWKVVESNADGKRYVNDVTGEETFVKRGENIRDTLMASEVAKAQRGRGSLSDDILQREILRQIGARDAQQAKDAMSLLREQRLMLTDIEKQVGEYEKGLLETDPNKKKALVDAKRAELMGNFSKLFADRLSSFDGEGTQSAPTAESALNAVNGGAKGGAAQKAQAQTPNADDAKRKAEIEALLKKRKAGGAEGSQAQAESPKQTQNTKSMELRKKNAERMKKKPVVDENGVVDMDSEDGRYRIWYVEHGSSSLSKEENWKRFKEYDEKAQARLKILGKGPKEDRWSRLH